MVSSAEREAKENLIALIAKGVDRICFQRDSTDSIIFAMNVAKEAKAITILSNNYDERCEVSVKRGDSNVMKLRERVFSLGKTSFSSILPITESNTPTILLGITSSVIEEKRVPTAWEESVMSSVAGNGINYEKSPPLISYRTMNIETSLKLSSYLFKDANKVKNRLIEENVNLKQKYTELTDELTIRIDEILREEITMYVPEKSAYYFDVDIREVFFAIRNKFNALLEFCWNPQYMYKVIADYRRDIHLV